MRATGIILGFAVLFAISPARAMGLEKFTWENRLLLVFAGGGLNLLLERQRRLLAPRKSGIRERHMRIVEISDSDAVEVDGRIDTSLDGSALRRAYEVPLKRFTAILIGKDGGEKGRWVEPVAVDGVFGMIDAMPMRQEEMRTDG